METCLLREEDALDSSLVITMNFQVAFSIFNFVFYVSQRGRTDGDINLLCASFMGEFIQNN